MKKTTKNTKQNTKKNTKLVSGKDLLRLKTGIKAGERMKKQICFAAG